LGSQQDAMGKYLLKGWETMIEENQQLVTYEPVEFEK
jgi:hypothetical protein